MMQMKFDIEPCGHVSPYKRIMIGHDDPVPKEPEALSLAEGMAVAAKASEGNRIWNLVVQSSSGSPIPAKTEIPRATAKKTIVFGGFFTELQKKGVPLLPTEVPGQLLASDGWQWLTAKPEAKVDIKTLDWTRLAEMND